MCWSGAAARSGCREALDAFNPRSLWCHFTSFYIYIFYQLIFEGLYRDCGSTLRYFFPPLCTMAPKRCEGLGCAFRLKTGRLRGNASQSTVNKLCVSLEANRVRIGSKSQRLHSRPGLEGGVGWGCTGPGRARSAAGMAEWDTKHRNPPPPPTPHEQNTTAVSIRHRNTFLSNQAARFRAEAENQNCRTWVLN